jgi:hypothetical protein
MHYYQILLDIGGPVPLLITGLAIIAGALGVLAASARRRRHDRDQLAGAGPIRPGTPVPPGFLS